MMVLAFPFVFARLHNEHIAFGQFEYPDQSLARAAFFHAFQSSPKTFFRILQRSAPCFLHSYRTFQHAFAHQLIHYRLTALYRFLDTVFIYVISRMCIFVRDQYLTIRQPAVFMLHLQQPVIFRIMQSPQLCKLPAFKSLPYFIFHYTHMSLLSLH